MSVLLVQLAGPLQAWGSTARFARRTTEAAPTKSGVLGLLAAALGRPRTADLADLAALRFGVRIDQPGTLTRDFQTAHHLDTGNALPVSERFYLADAVFVAGLEGPQDLLTEAFTALRHPVFLPYLGRRSCPPSRPVELSLQTGRDLPQALAKEQWRAASWHQRRHHSEPQVQLEILIESDDGRGDLQRDQPLSFDPAHRRYAFRGVRRLTVSVPNPKAAPAVQHDPTTVLRSE